MESNGDRRERTVYVSGMHPSVSEEILYELFLQAGPVEKVVLHEFPDGSPRHALIVFKHIQSVMYSIALLNGSALFDRPLALRPLRESSHAAVLQQVMASQRRAALAHTARLTNQEAAMKTPPTSPVYDTQDEATARSLKTTVGASETENQMPKSDSFTPLSPIGSKPLNQIQTASALRKQAARGDVVEDSKSPPPVTKNTQMWKKYTSGASSAAWSGGCGTGRADWLLGGYPNSTTTPQQGGARSDLTHAPWAPTPGFCAPIPAGFQNPNRYATGPFDFPHAFGPISGAGYGCYPPGFTTPSSGHQNQPYYFNGGSSYSGASSGTNPLTVYQKLLRESGAQNY